MIIRTLLSSDRLAQFKEKLIEERKKSISCPPRALRRLHVRFSSGSLHNSSVFDKLFPTYNAIKLPFENCELILSEGPDQHDISIFSTSIERFLHNTLLNTTFPIRIFFVAGSPSQNHGFVNYYSIKDDSIEISFQQVIKILAHGANEETIKELQNQVNKIQNVPLASKFYIFRQKGKYALAINIDNWPDHGLVDLTEGDKFLLLLIATINPRLLAHCSAGLGRSATILSVLLMTQKRLALCANEDELIKSFCNDIQKMRSVKPNILYDVDQCMLVLRWVDEIERIHAQHKYLFASLKMQMLSNVQSVEQLEALLREKFLSGFQGRCALTSARSESLLTRDFDLSDDSESEYEERESDSSNISPASIDTSSTLFSIKSNSRVTTQLPPPSSSPLSRSYSDSTVPSNSLLNLNLAENDDEDDFERNFERCKQLKK